MGADDPEVQYLKEDVKETKDDVKEIKGDVKELTSAVNDIKVLMVGNYVHKKEFEAYKKDQIKEFETYKKDKIEEFGTYKQDQVVGRRWWAFYIITIVGLLKL